MRAALALALVCSSAWACAPAKPPRDDAASLKKTRYVLTHYLIGQDACFESSIQQILPQGTSRMSADDFASVPKPASFEPGVTTSSQVRDTLGTPAGETKDKHGHLVYSYDAPGGVVIAYRFDGSGKLERVYGYRVVAPDWP